MQVIKDNLVLCDECTQAAINDDYTSLDYYYTNDAQRDHRERSIREGLQSLGANLVPNFDSETGEGIDEFSARICDSCGFRFAGGRHRFAILG